VLRNIKAVCIISLIFCNRRYLKSGFSYNETEKSKRETYECTTIAWPAFWWLGGTFQLAWESAYGLRFCYVLAAEKVCTETVTYLANIFKYYVTYKLIQKKKKMS